MVDSNGTTGFRKVIVEAQAEFRLVMEEGYQKTGKRPTKEHNGHNNVERQSNIQSGMKVI